MVFVTLLRGINVGGHNIVPMDRLRAALTRRGLGTVKTYIQSGNIVSQGPDAATVRAVVTQALAEEFQVRSDVVTLTADALSAAVGAQPFAPDDPKQVHLYFPCQPGVFVNTGHLKSECTAGEDVVWQAGILYLHTPGGFGRSPLAAKLPRLVSAPLTARNLNTATKLADMAGALALGDL